MQAEYKLILCRFPSLSSISSCVANLKHPLVFLSVMTSAMKLLVSADKSTTTRL